MSVRPGGQQSTEVANHESGLVLEVSHLMDGDEKVGLGHLDGASNLGRQKNETGERKNDMMANCPLKNQLLSIHFSPIIINIINTKIVAVAGFTTTLLLLASFTGLVPTAHLGTAR